MEIIELRRGKKGKTILWTSGSAVFHIRAVSANPYLRWNPFRPIGQRHNLLLQNTYRQALFQHLSDDQEDTQSGLSTVFLLPLPYWC